MVTAPAPEGRNAWSEQFPSPNIPLNWPSASWVDRVTPNSRPKGCKIGNPQTTAHGFLEAARDSVGGHFHPLTRSRATSTNQMIGLLLPPLKVCTATITMGMAKPVVIHAAAEQDVCRPKAPEGSSNTRQITGYISVTLRKRVYSHTESYKSQNIWAAYDLGNVPLYKQLSVNLQNPRASTKSKHWPQSSNFVWLYDSYVTLGSVYHVILKT